jgi:aryl carrier-like protein
LREFAADRLVHFKVPRRVVFVDELPKGPTGKPQRIGLAQRLGITAAHDPAPARNTDDREAATITEKQLAEIWCAVLRVPRVGGRDDFFALGGDSILATQVVARVRAIWRVEVSVARLLETPTLEAFAAMVERSTASMPVSDQALKGLIDEIRDLPDAEVERQLREAEMTGQADPSPPAGDSVPSAGGAEDSPT